MANRRSFLKKAVALGGAAPLAISAGADARAALAAPNVHVPETKVDAGIYSGLRHTALVPDTLDLADRAELGIRGIGGTIDPDLHYMMYFSIHYHWRTPVMTHHSADPTCDPKYTESLPMLRLMCGTDRVMWRTASLPTWFPASTADSTGTATIRRDRGGCNTTI